MVPPIVILRLIVFNLILLASLRPTYGKEAVSERLTKTIILVVSDENAQSNASLIRAMRAGLSDLAIRFAVVTRELETATEETIWAQARGIAATSDGAAVFRLQEGITTDLFVYLPLPDGEIMERRHLSKRSDIETSETAAVIVRRIVLAALIDGDRVDETPAPVSVSPPQQHRRACLPGNFRSPFTREGSWKPLYPACCSRVHSFPKSNPQSTLWSPGDDFWSAWGYSPHSVYLRPTLSNNPPLTSKRMFV